MNIKCLKNMLIVVLSLVSGMVMAQAQDATYKEMIEKSNLLENTINMIKFKCHGISGQSLDEESVKFRQNFPIVCARVERLENMEERNRIVMYLLPHVRSSLTLEQSQKVLAFVEDVDALTQKGTDQSIFKASQMTDDFVESESGHAFYSIWFDPQVLESVIKSLESAEE